MLFLFDLLVMHVCFLLSYYACNVRLLFCSYCFAYHVCLFTCFVCKVFLYLIVLLRLFVLMYDCFISMHY